jgi:hypothetical protein
MVVVGRCTTNRSHVLASFYMRQPSLSTNVMKRIVHARRTRIVQVKEEAWFFFTSQSYVHIIVLQVCSP